MAFKEYCGEPCPGKNHFLRTQGVWKKALPFSQTWHQTTCPKPTVLAQKHTLGVLSPRLRASPGAMVSWPDVPLTV